MATVNRSWVRNALLRIATAALTGLIVGCGGGAGSSDQPTSALATSPAASSSSAEEKTIAETAAFDSGELADTSCGITTFNWPSGVAESRVGQAYAEITDVIGVVGRYHTGLDVSAGGAAQQAVAITQGRVVGIFDSSKYTVNAGQLVSDVSPTGKVRLDGIVLLKHTDASQSVYWSMYGHLDTKSTLPFKLGDCVAAGTAFGATLAARNHHLHIEVKSKPVETNPTQLSGACGTDSKCWGYTSLSPASLGFLDPVSYIFGALKLSASTRFVARDTYFFRASPARNDYQLSERTFGQASVGVSYLAVEKVSSPNKDICSAGWYRVKITDEPNCSQVGQCFQHDSASKSDLPSPDKWVESIASAWVCCDGGSINNSLLCSKVTLTVNNPLTTPITQAVTTTVIPETEFLSSTLQVTVPGWSIVGMSIDVGANSIAVEYTGWDFTAVSSFNGYVLRFDAAAPSIISCLLNPLSSYMPVQVGVTCNAHEVFINVSGIQTTSSSRILVDLLLGPPTL